MAEGIVPIIVAVAVVVFVLASLYNAVHVVKEKEAVVIERFGCYMRTLAPGVHWVIPWVDWPRRYTHRYFVTNQRGHTELRALTGAYRISTQNEVLDFPKQAVITRDNAKIHLDAILQYRIVNPVKMIYASQNVPMMLSKLLQAQIRNIAGLMDVDQIIEDVSALNRVSVDMDAVAARWGVKVEFVRIQRVDAGSLTQVLAQKKNADLENKEVIIHAKAQKQTDIINSEGQRDRMIKEAEGESQRMISQARGQAQAVRNRAVADAKAVAEIARAVARCGENPTRYLLAVKYIEALESIMASAQGETQVELLPMQTSFLQVSAEEFGVNTVLPRSKKDR
jgi:regulator of protease activity HflC (stomatin/prohibitin superfamily)